MTRRPATETPTDASRGAWVCPRCGSANIRVFYIEERQARVVDCDDGDPTPWPSPTDDELVDIDPLEFIFECVGGCGAIMITPVRMSAASARRR